MQKQNRKSYLMSHLKNIKNNTYQAYQAGILTGG